MPYGPIFSYIFLQVSSNSEAVGLLEFTCRNCGGGDRGRVAIYRPFGEVSLSLNRTVTCMVLKANDRRTSCPCHDEFRGPRSDYVRQFTCRNCGGGDRGRVAIYRPFGEVSLSLNRTVTCMVLKANDRRTSCPCHDEFRGPRSDYVRQAWERVTLFGGVKRRIHQIPFVVNNNRADVKITVATLGTGDLPSIIIKNQQGNRFSNPY
ncbi:uncharacterized protein TNCV_4191371 [Trichonephila clavipes]|nr:uncharacterized protein TNCV_4191371 [Trichonephila clavipes]